MNFADHQHKLLRGFKLVWWRMVQPMKTVLWSVYELSLQWFSYSHPPKMQQPIRHLLISWHWNRLSQRSDFTLTPLGNIVSSHYSSSRRSRRDCAQLLSSVASAFKQWRDVQAAKLLSCRHKGPRCNHPKSLTGACIEMSSLFQVGDASNAICLMRRSGAELEWLTKCYLKTVSWITWVLWSCPLSVLNMLSATGTASMILAHSPIIFAACSVYRMPQITALVDSRCSNPQWNCEG